MNFAQLSEVQQETITYLIGDILDGDVSPVNVATKDAARISLARFEAAADTLLVDKCAEELARYGVEVAEDMTPEEPDDYDPYIITKKLTFKGLRLELAREKFFESVTCNMEVGDE